MNMYDVIVVGDANPDLIFTGFNRLPSMGQEVFSKNVSLNLGGGAALCAGGLAKLGLNVALIAVVGTDFYGDFIVSKLEKLGVDTKLIKRSNHQSTGITVAMADDEERAFMSYRGTNGEMILDKVPSEHIKKGRHIHILGYSQQTHGGFVALVKKAKDLGLTVSCDVGWDPTEKWDISIFDMLSFVDVFTPNQVEALSYTRAQNPEEALEVLSKYVSMPAIKMGRFGSMGKRNGVAAYMPSFKVNSVDTTGAGDSFNAGFIYSFLRELPIDQALSVANACGALSTTAYGGNTAFPTLKQLKTFFYELGEKYQDISLE